MKTGVTNRLGRKETLLLMACCLFGGLAFLKLLQGDGATGGISAGIAILCYLLLNMKNVESFEFLALKAKFRDQIAEANSLIEGLRSALKEFGKSAVTQLSLPRFDHNGTPEVSFASQWMQAAAIVNSLGTSGLTKADLSEVKHMLIVRHCDKMVADIYAGVSTKFQRTWDTHQNYRSLLEKFPTYSGGQNCLPGEYEHFSIALDKLLGLQFPEQDFRKLQHIIFRAKTSLREIIEWDVRTTTYWLSEHHPQITHPGDFADFLF